MQDTGVLMVVKTESVSSMVPLSNVMNSGGNMTSFVSMNLFCTSIYVVLIPCLSTPFIFCILKWVPHSSFELQIYIYIYAYICTHIYTYIRFIYIYIIYAYMCTHIYYIYIKQCTFPIIMLSNPRLTFANICQIYYPCAILQGF